MPLIVIMVYVQVSIGLYLNIYQLVGSLIQVISVPVVVIAAPVGVVALLVIATAVALVICCYYSTVNRYKWKLEQAQQPVYA